MFNFRVIINILSLLVAINGLAILTAIPFSLYYQETETRALAISGCCLILLGISGWFLTRKFANRELKKRDGYLVVSLGWLTMAALGAIPYIISGAIPSYTDAFFETMSGYTTTGATILGDQIEALPKGLHFWRAMTHWIGGMGIIVLTIAILPLLGIGGMQLYAAEVPGPTPDKLTPRIKETAKRLWIIYVSLTLAECMLLMMGGMNFYDGICHAMATLSTGGFSTRQASMGAFTAFHQYVVIVFMFIAGTNFSLTYFLFKGKAKRLWENEEFRLYLWFCLAIILLVTAVTWFRLDISMEEAFRNASFQVISIITTTGFGTADFTAWGPLMMVLFFMLMFNGACAGSTSGGMKMIRFLVLYKNSYYELKRQ
ncbi:MAG: potassium transporter TrkG, partial [Bacteroidota bacterium]